MEAQTFWYQYKQKLLSYLQAGWFLTLTARSRLRVSVPLAGHLCDVRQWGTEQISGVVPDPSEVTSRRWAGAVGLPAPAVFCEVRAPPHVGTRRCRGCRRCTLPPWSCSDQSLSIPDAFALARRVDRWVHWPYRSDGSLRWENKNSIDRIMITIWIH